MLPWALAPYGKDVVSLQAARDRDDVVLLHQVERPEGRAS